MAWVFYFLRRFLVLDINSIIKNIINENRTIFYEHEIYIVFKHLGLDTVNYYFSDFNKEVEKIPFACSEVVVKVVSADILHKTELGGVKFCKNNIADINAAINKIKNSTSSFNVKGFLIVEKINYKSFLASELLISLRHTDDFDYLVNFGIGGINTEIYGSNFKNSFSIIASSLFNSETLSNNLIYKILNGENREGVKYIDNTKIVNTINAIIKIKDFINDNFKDYILDECEVNPFVIFEEKLIPLDGILKIKKQSNSKIIKKPLEKLESLFKPKSICIAGVSSKNMNMGRIILNNILHNGFNSEDLCVLKENDTSIDGVKCVSNVNLLEKKYDLFVMAINAASSLEMIKDIIKYGKANSIILIPGGFAETDSGKFLEQAIVDEIIKSRASGGPILVGGNCLGVISYPGKYDTFFIPKNKISYNEPKPYAFISQSGAFIISKLSKTNLTPTYAVSIGNQMDLTVSDYLDYFINNKEVNVIGLYIEGFKELDGIKTAIKVKELVNSGKKVIIYKAGRSSSGAKAASGHTASIAGDYNNFEAIFKDVGAIIVKDFCEFEDLLKISLFLSKYNLRKANLGILSNAGFETVGIADNLDCIPEFSNKTCNEIKQTLAEYKIDKLVSVHNPLDITPVATDKVYIDCFNLVLKDNNINCGILSCIPMTGAIKSIKEEIDDTSLFSKINEIKEDVPFFVVVDCGKLYDYACSLISKVPVFRETDRLVKGIIRYFN